MVEPLGEKQISRTPPKAWQTSAGVMWQGFIDMHIHFSAYDLVNNHKNHKNIEIFVPHLRRNK